MVSLDGPTLEVPKSWEVQSLWESQQEQIAASKGGKKDEVLAKQGRNPLCSQQCKAYSNYALTSLNSPVASTQSPVLQNS